MNEVWVPSEWQRQSFIASGVEASKLFVVPEVLPPSLRDRDGVEAEQLPGCFRFDRSSSSSGWVPVNVVCKRQSVKKHQ